jgi:hypothetical protein
LPISKLRVATVLAHRGLLKEKGKAYSAALDTALGVAALVPGAQEVAGVFLAGKAAIELAGKGATLLRSGAEWIDSWLFANTMSAYFEAFDKAGELGATSRANDELMGDWDPKASRLIGVALPSNYAFALKRSTGWRFSFSSLAPPRRARTNTLRRSTALISEATSKNFCSTKTGRSISWTGPAAWER